MSWSKNRPFKTIYSTLCAVLLGAGFLDIFHLMFKNPTSPYFLGFRLAQRMAWCEELGPVLDELTYLQPIFLILTQPSWDGYF
jgi:hypothetical protein